MKKYVEGVKVDNCERVSYIEKALELWIENVTKVVKSGERVVKVWENGLKVEKVY